MHDERGAILIGFDGSDESEDAIRRAAELLGPRRAIVANVWDSLAELLLHTDAEQLGGLMRVASDEIDADVAKRAEATAEHGAEIAEDAGLAATALTARGRPKAWPTLLELADAHEVGAVVVGSRGLGRAKSALLGSVSAGLLGHARQPVLVVPPATEPNAPGPVVIGYDGSADADGGIRAAGRLLAVREVVLETAWSSYEQIAPAALAGAPVVVVSRAVEELDEEVRTAAQRTVERGVRLAAAQGLEAGGETPHGAGQPWRQLLEAAQAHRAPAIVVGSRGRSAFGAALLGSTSRALVHHATMPVMVVRGQ